MRPSAPAYSPPGFFGKLPARGDFLARRVPAGLRDQWEAWLSSLVVSARSALGEAWPADWLTAPLWHFTLGRLIAPPAGAAGVLVASVDRVGRFFPFSVIGAAADTGLDAEGWGRVMESLAVAALGDAFDPDGLDAALVALGPPGRMDGAERPVGAWPLALWNDWPASPLDALAEQGWYPPGPEQSVWWCRGSERMPPMQVRCQGLPDALLSGALVAGFEAAK